MQDLPKLPNRHSVRLKTYDYSQPSAYFITICTHANCSIFGEVLCGEMKLNAIGEIANQSWTALVDHFANIRLSKYVVMPNHLHGIVSIQQRATHGARLRAKEDPSSECIVAGSLPAIIRSFKAAVSKQVRRLRGKPSFEVWQRGYYEHVIRNQRDYENVCEYIRLNPARWHLRGEDEAYTSATD